MNFTEAVAALQDGESIQRSSWHHDKSVRLLKTLGGGTRMFLRTTTRGGGSDPRWEDRVWAPEWDDITAPDWRTCSASLVEHVREHRDGVETLTKVSVAIAEQMLSAINFDIVRVTGVVVQAGGNGDWRIGGRVVVGIDAAAEALVRACFTTASEGEFANLDPKDNDE